MRRHWLEEKFSLHCKVDVCVEACSTADFKREREKKDTVLQTGHPWTVNVCMCGINKRTTQKSRPMLRWLFSEGRYLRLDGTAFEGSVFFFVVVVFSLVGFLAVRMATSSARLSLRSSFLSRTSLEASYQPVVGLSSVSFLFAHLWQCHCLFFPPSRVASCCKKWTLLCFFLFFFCISQRYNNECTPTDWNKTQSLYQLTVV